MNKSISQNENGLKDNSKQMIEKSLIEKSIIDKFSCDNLTTKEKILYASLTLFSQRGYEGVTMRDIAAAVDIKGSSIYKHYESKQKIFESIIEYMNKQYEVNMLDMHIPMGTVEEVADVYCRINKEELYEIVKKIFHYFLNDDYASKFRRILIMERYKNTRISELFIKIYYNNAIDFQESLFRVLMQKGYFKNVDVHTMVVQFYAPIFLFLNVYDQNTEKIAEADALIRNHVYQFYEIYQA